MASASFDAVMYACAMTYFVCINGHIILKCTFYAIRTDVNVLHNWKLINTKNCAFSSAEWAAVPDKAKKEIGMDVRNDGEFW